MPTQSQGKRRLPTHDLPAKRFRVSRACDACRTAREKCDGKQPVCEPCLEAKRGCAYTSNPKKRGLQPGYIRSLEMTLALVFQHEPDVEIMVNRRLAQQNSVLLARGTKESNRLHKSWAKSKFCRDVNRALSGGQIGSGDDKMPSSDEDSEVDVEQDGLFRVDTDPGFHSQVGHSCYPMRCTHSYQSKCLGSTFQNSCQTCQPQPWCQNRINSRLGLPGWIPNSRRSLRIAGRSSTHIVRTRNVGCL